MSKNKIFTYKDAISILDFYKDKELSPVEALFKWKIKQSNTISEEDEHGLSVVGIFEHPITNKKGKEIGKIIIFNYTGVGGGWHNDIYDMVELKYFSDTEYYKFEYGDNESFYYRLYLTGDIFSEENFKEWEQPNKKPEFRVFKQKLPKSEFIILYDISEDRYGSEMSSELRQSGDHCFFYDHSACMYFIKNISNLKFKPSKPIIQKRIKDRLK